MRETEVDVVLIQEPSLSELERWHLTLPGYQSFHHLSAKENGYGALVLVHGKWSGRDVGYISNYATGVRIDVGAKIVELYSVYCRPRLSLPEVIDPLFSFMKKADRTVVGMDANAKHESWNSETNNDRGKTLLYYLQRWNLKVINSPESALNYIPRDTAFVDVTLKGENVNVSGWKYLRRDFMSDHPCIQFDVHI